MTALRCAETASFPSFRAYVGRYGDTVVTGFHTRGPVVLLTAVKVDSYSIDTI